MGMLCSLWIEKTRTVEEVYLGLGTNLGEREKNLDRAMELIDKRIGSIFSRSAFYSTEPWGYRSERIYLNAAIGVKSLLSPLEVLEKTQEIEREMGRTHKTNSGIYEDRIIDIDLLLYGSCIIREDRLVVPHPWMAQREFVLVPLAEITPAYLHPVLGKQISELAAELGKASWGK